MYFYSRKNDVYFTYTLNLGLEGGQMRKSFKQIQTIMHDSPVKNVYSKTSYFSLPHALIMIPGYFEALLEFYRIEASK
jgi:hypothetical protein